MPSQDFQRVLNHIRQTSRSEKEKGYRFEKLMLSFLKNDSRYERQFKNVWLWNQYPERKHQDLGIDLVAETYNGDKVAIQCKCYKETATLSKENIDSFLNELGKKDFQEGIIVSTTDNWSDNAEKSLAGRSKKCVRIGVTELEESDIQDWWSLYKKAKASLPTKKKLRPHQKNALDNVINGFKKCNRGKLIMPCGTGKTFTALKIAEKMTKPNGNVLILMPSLSLVSQTHREFMQNSSKEINAFIICSDNKAGKDSEDIGKMDLALPPTTDYEELAIKLNSSPKGPNKINVIFSTYHSIEVVSQAQRQRGTRVFDLIICDEAHRTTGVESKNRDDAKKSYWTQVHNGKFIKASKRLYMTATPRIYTETAKEKARNRDYEIYSMNDESIYGKDFHELKFSEAISRGLLTDYKVVVLAINDAVVSEAMQDAFAQNNEIQTDDAVKIVGCWNALAKKFLNDNKDWGILGEGYKDITDKQPMQRAVAFSSTIAESRLIKNHFERVINEINSNKKNSSILECEVRHVDGGMNSLTRGKEIRWLKGETDKIKPNQCRILSNARCLSEGVDVPSLDAVMFLKARKSEIDIVQSVGRVMRKPSDPNQRKEFGYIILPIVIQSGIEPHEALKENERYQVIWKVIQALRSHDDRLEAEIDKLPYSKKMPSNVVVGVIGQDDKSEKISEEKIEQQLRFSFVQDWKKAIVAKLVLKCGDREYLDKLAIDVERAFQILSKRMSNSLKAKDQSSYKRTLEKFLDSLRATLNESITQGQAIEMLAMHSVTKPLFQALFETQDSFTHQNPVSRSMDKALKLFSEQVQAETRELKNSYDSIKRRVQDIDTLEARQNLIKELYQIVFKKGFPKMQEQLGIVYTPIEVVDFILESSNEILEREFNGESLSSQNVKILDPFSGTGTFLTRLIENKNLIKDKDLQRKYNSEILSSEIVLLAYYITTINVESSYHFRKKEIIQSKRNLMPTNEYERFKGAIFADTFQATESSDQMSFQFFQENDKQRKRLKKEAIRVIVGNPPYSVGQKDENDNNKNLKYNELDKNIAETYVKSSNATLKRSVYDSYVRAIRWATDKVNSNPKGGVVSFITNGSFIDRGSMDGLRHHLEKDFTSLYILNLRGDIKSAIRGHDRSLAQREGGNIFGQNCTNSVAISFLVKNPSKESCEISYCDIGDSLSQKEKLQKIKDFKNIFEIKDWQKVIPNRHNDWINQRDENYKNFISMGNKSNPEDTLFKLYSMGVKTNRDSWAYNFDKKTLAKNIEDTIKFYNKELERYKKEKKRPKNIDSFVNNDSSKIKWARRMKTNFKKEKIIKYDEKNIRSSLYRPFCKTNLYYGKDLNEEIYQTFRIYPNYETKNLAICISGIGAKTSSVLMTEVTPEHLLLGNMQYFPRYIFQENMGKMEKADNISKNAVEKFKAHYNDKSINADKMFFYIYGLLHSKCYREKYKNDLTKEIPRIPIVNDFHQFSEIGKKLSDLHVNYETAKKHKGLSVPIQSSLVENKQLFKVKKMKHPKKNNKEDKSQIIYNDFVTISGIPEKAYEYEVNGYSTIKWIMDRYQVKKCSKSEIINDPNRNDDPKYILNLLQRIVHISIESVDLINSLPKITQWGFSEEAQYSEERLLEKEAKKVKEKLITTKTKRAKSNSKKKAA